MDSEANVLFPAELQSGEAEQLKASGGKSHEPGSSLEHLRSGFLRRRPALPASIAASFYNLPVQEKSQLQVIF